MQLKYDYWTGHFEEVKGSLIRNISQYSINNTEIKIGITNDPERRIKEHQNNNLGWKKMIVKYQTNSVNYINIMEELLINYHWEYLSNIRGGGGESKAKPPYYLYILIK